MKSVKPRIRKSFFQLSAAKICCIYLVIGLGWILFSDSFIFLFTSRDDLIHWISTIKGFLFVIVTALILYGLIRYYITEIEDRQMLYQGVIENACSIIIKTDRHLNITVYNEYAEQKFKKTAALILGTSLYDFLGPDTRIPEAWKKILASSSKGLEIPPSSFEMEYQDSAQKTIWILWTVTYGRRRDETEDSLLLIGTDISALKESEKSLFLINRAIHTISECNQAIIHKTDEESLLSEVCQILVETGGNRMAWIGYVPEDTNQLLVPMAYAGHVEGYLETLPLQGTDSSSTRDPCIIAIQTGTVQIRRYSQITFDDPSLTEMITRGYATSIALPLHDGTTVYGVLAIYAPRPDSFDEQEIGMLTGLAEDISFGIQVIRTHKTLAIAQTELFLSEERLRLAMEATNDGLWDWNIQTGDAVCSPRYASMLGYEIGDLPESFATWTTLVHPDDALAVNATLASAIQNGTEFSAEFRMKMKNGGWKWILSRGIVVSWDKDSRPLRMVGTNSDIADRKESEQMLKQAAQELRNAISHIDQNMSTLSTLNDMIRNPLTVLAILSDEIGGDIQEKTMTQIKAIDQIIKELDKGWIESEKVRNYLRKHHGLFE